MAGETTLGEPTDREDSFALSLVRGDPLLRLQRAVGLVPREGLGVGRRALALALVTFTPIAVWAVATGHALPGGVVSEPLLQHFGVTVRCLVAIPLFVLAEGLAHATTRRLLPHFVASGLVPPDRVEAFREVLRGVARLRDAVLPWVVIAAVALAWTGFAPATPEVHELAWAERTQGAGTLGFGGWWFVYVVRPIYLALVLGWLWRVVVAFVLLRRIAGLGLSLVPTHPDGAGGLGFAGGFTRIFGPVALGAGAVFAGHLAHGVAYHGVQVASLRVQMIGFVVLMVVLFVAPLLALAPPLLALRRTARLAYGALVAEHGRRVHSRWIAGEPVEDDPMLGAPELGPVADTIALYGAVEKMRPVPIGMPVVLAVAVPALLPMLAVLAIQVPLKDLLLALLKALA
jgi:hypothetical protein